jgi:outer membrane protein OmpA-like peptidoglycan-associated protein
MQRPGLAAIACLALLAGCAAPPDHAQQADAIEANVQQTFDGDVGALIYHGYEAARLAQAADAARAELSSLPSYSPANVNISDKANEMSEQAAEQRRQAEGALNRILDPLRERIAKLEQQQGKVQAAGADPGQTAPAGVTAVLRFAAGSAAVPDKEMAKLQAVASYLKSHPHAAVAITGWSDGTGGGTNQAPLARARADAVYAALTARGLPPETTVAISAAPPPGEDAAGRRVEIVVRPLG